MIQNVTRDRECLESWLSDEWDVSIVPTRCIDVYPQCVSCSVSNNVTTKSFLLLRGLCHDSKFDKWYQGNVFHGLGKISFPLIMTCYFLVKYYWNWWSITKDININKYF